MADNWAHHHAAVAVNAPIHEVYSLFTHFNAFPKIMSFVKEVTYLDEQHSHWTTEVMGPPMGCHQRGLAPRSADWLAFDEWSGKHWASDLPADDTQPDTYRGLHQL